MGRMAMKILLTGGAGFIGSAIADMLAEKGHQVIVYDVGTWDTNMGNIQHIKGDIFDANHLASVLRKCDNVIHIVGLADARTAQEHPQMSFDLNIRSLQVLLEAVRNSDNSRVILPSSAAVYGIVDQPLVTEQTIAKPASLYAYHKYTAEKLAEAYVANYGTHVTILRLFNVYGIGGTGILNILLGKAVRGEPVKLYGENQKRDFVHVSDVADAFATVLELDHRFEVYNVGTGIGRSIRDIVDLVKIYFPNLSVEYVDYKGVLFDSVADTTKLRDAIGFNPDGSDRKLRGTIEAMIK
jgi:UDP-glucose 4-epimerase